jgi:hypothetical protein
MHGGTPIRFFKSIQMPFSKIEGVITTFIENMSNGFLIGIKPVFVPWYAFMGIKTGKHGSSERAAQWITGDRIGKEHAGTAQVVQIRCMNIEVPINAEGLSPLLIRHDPKHILFSFTHDSVLPFFSSCRVIN